MSKELSVQVVHGARKLPLTFPNGDIPLRFLAEEITMQTDIPVKNQKLICKGRSLVDMEKTLTELGIKNKSKIMLIGKKITIEEDQNTGAMNGVEKQIGTSEKRIAEIQEETKGIENGHLPAEHHVEASAGLLKRTGICAEHLTRYLESLDALTLTDSAPELRIRRKGLVTRIQTNLDVCDGLQTKLTAIKEKKT